MSKSNAPRILVLEDEWLIADLIRTALEDAGYKVLGPAGRISHALALLEREKCDAAVLDLNLHGERSFVVAEALVKTSTPFVFVSGYSATLLPASFAKIPLLQKPIDAADLHRCVAMLLASPTAT